jgi:hypothetical protein
VGRREKKYRRIYIYKHRLKVGLKKQGDNWSNRSLLSEFWAPGEGPWMLSKLSRTTTCGFCAVDDSGLFAPRMVAIMPNGVDIGVVRHFLSPEIPFVSRWDFTTFLSIKSSFFWGNSVNFHPFPGPIYGPLAHLGAPPIEGFLGRGPCNRLNRQMTSRNLQVP